MLGAFLKKALAGQADAPAFVEALAPLELDELERSFRAWLLAEFRQAWPELPLDLTVLGKSSLRSLFDLASPLSVRYGLELVSDSEKTDAFFFLGMGVCDDGANNFVWAANLKGLKEAWIARRLASF